MGQLFMTLRAENMGAENLNFLKLLKIMICDCRGFMVLSGSPEH